MKLICLVDQLKTALVVKRYKTPISIECFLQIAGIINNMQQEKPVILSLSRDTVLGAEIDNIVGFFWSHTTDAWR